MCVLTAAVCSTVFGGEFKFADVKDLSDDQKAAYIKTNTECKNESAIRHFYLIKMVVGAKVDKKITNANLISSIDALVAESKLTGDSAVVLKAFLMVNAQYWAGLQRDEAFKSAVETMLNSSETVAALKRDRSGASQLASFYGYLNRRNEQVEVLLTINPAQAFITAVRFKLGQESYVKTANAVTKDATKVSTPKVLSDVVDCIGKLNNPVYDEQVKTLLVVLNRQCYPKIQMSEQWKAAVVKLQLVMKAYNL